MIRMGRGNRTDEPTTTGYEPQPANEPYRYNETTSAAAIPSRGAISESDSMARDIKEGRLSGFVGHGTTLTGETDFTAMLRVDGHLVGSVTSESGTLIVGTNGQVDANVMVAAATINGTVNGDVLATEKLHLGRTARVLGNIQSPRLIIEEGAILEGGCSMLKLRETQEEETTASYESAPEPESAQSSLLAMTETDDEESAYATDEEDEEEADAAAV